MAPSKTHRTIKNLQLSIKLSIRNFLIASLINIGGTVLGTIFFHEYCKFTQRESFALALTCVFCALFLFNRYVIYASKRMELSRQFFRYFWVSVGIQIGEYLFYRYYLEHYDYDYRLAVLAASCLGAFLRWFFFRYYVFAR